LQGEYWVARRDFSKALAAYQKALTLKPTASQIHLALGWIYLNEDRSDEAISNLEAELRSDPYSVPALVGLGEVYYKRGQSGRAKEYLRQALTINRDSPQAHLWLGKLSAKERSSAEAVEHFQAALKSGVYYREPFYFELSQALRQLGRTEEAARYLALFRQSKDRRKREEQLPMEEMK